MFDRVVAARNEKGKGIRTLLFGVSAALHAAGIAGLLVWSFWTVEKVAPKTVPVSFLATAAPPPPPPPPPAPPPPQKVTSRPPIKVVKETVQPTAKPDPDPRREREPSDTPPTSGPVDPNATGPGVPGGVPGGTGTTPCTGPDCGGPPVVEKPVVIDMKTAEAARISGNREIPLPPAVSQELRAQGQPGTSAQVKLCLSAQGEPTKVIVAKSTGFPAADQRIVDEVQAWRYRPYTVNGRAVPICTAVVFQYRLE